MKDAVLVHREILIKHLSKTLYLPPPVDRKHDGEGEGEVGRDLEEVVALVQRLLHHLVLLDVHVHDRFLQVPEMVLNRSQCGS